MYTASKAFTDELIQLKPPLMAFARKLTGDNDRAKDLLQWTMAQCIAKHAQYAEGTHTFRRGLRW